MRTSLTLAALTATTLALAGCNRPPLQAPQQVSCNCPATQPGGEDLQRLAPPPVRYRHAARYHRTWRNYDDSEGPGKGYERGWSYSQQNISSYSYQSHSRVYDSDDSAYSSGSVQARAYARAYAGSGSYASSSSGGYGGDAAHYETSDQWRDGYGRSRTHLGAKALRKRLDPWHGYNRDWD